MVFKADYPGAIVVEAANYGYTATNKPKTWGFHTPEEKADDDPQTPGYLAGTTRNASYTYFVSTLGFIFQLVPESEGAYAHALYGKSAPSWSDGTNLNLQSFSLSFEGHAATIHQTMPRGSPQWNAAVNLVAHRTPALGLNLDIAFQHKDVSNQRSDCGQWDQEAFIQDVRVKMEDDMGMTPQEREEFGRQIDALRGALGADAISYPDELGAHLNAPLLKRIEALEVHERNAEHHLSIEQIKNGHDHGSTSGVSPAEARSIAQEEDDKLRITRP